MVFKLGGFSLGLAVLGFGAAKLFAYGVIAACVLVLAAIALGLVE